MIFRQHWPAEPLRPFVESLWYCEGYQAPHGKERVLPNGRSSLVIELANGYIRQWDRALGSQSFFDDSPALIVGLRSTYEVIDTAGLKAMAGVVFRPGCARAFFQCPAHEFSLRDIPLDQVWGSAAARLRCALQQAKSPDEKFSVLIQALTERLEQRFAMHSSVAYALREIHKSPQHGKISNLAEEVGLSRRHFADVFREQVGLTPKLYCRVLRFQQAVRQIRRGQEVDWARLALDCGYCDQAHLAHEFREFSGLSPGTYSARDHLWRNHVAID